MDTDQIVSQDDQDVKEEEYLFSDPSECDYEGCHEPVFRYGLCFTHFVAEEDRRWDDQQAEREACLAGVGYA